MAKRKEHSENIIKMDSLQFEGSYSSGSPIGIHKHWYEYSGVISQQITYTNEKNYSGISYHENGKKSMQYTVVYSLKEGVEYTWYNNGVKKRVVNYKNGKLHGSYKEWYSNGNLKFEKNYVNGKEVF